MGEPHVVSALRDKRAELAGLAQHHEAQALTFRREMGHVDAVLRLYAPAIDPESIPPRRYRHRDPNFRNKEATRLICDVLRGVEAPMATNEIARRVMALKKMAADDEKVIGQICQAVYKTLTRQRDYFLRHDDELDEQKWSMLDPMELSLFNQ